MDARSPQSRPTFHVRGIRTQDTAWRVPVRTILWSGVGDGRITATYFLRYLCRVTGQEITIAFNKRLELEGLDFYPTYVEFTNAHWVRYQEILDDFCREHNLRYYDHAKYIQEGVLMYLAFE